MALERDLARREADELRIENLQGRKRSAVLRLRLASAEECNRVYQENQATLQQQLACMAEAQRMLQAQVAGLQQQLSSAQGDTQTQHGTVAKQQVGL